MWYAHNNGSHAGETLKPDAPDGSLHTTIWTVIPGNSSWERAGPCNIIMCERLDEPSVCQHAANRTSETPCLEEKAEDWKHLPPSSHYCYCYGMLPCRRVPQQHLKLGTANGAADYNSNFYPRLHQSASSFHRGPNKVNEHGWLRSLYLLQEVPTHNFILIHPSIHHQLFHLCHQVAFFEGSPWPGIHFFLPNLSYSV